MSLRPVVIMVLLSIMFSTCLDKIDFDTPRGLSNSIAVDARLIKSDTSIIELIVSNVFDFESSGRRPIGIRNPILEDEKGVRLDLQPIGIGKYRSEITNDLMHIDFESSYKIAFETFDGRRYESNFEMLYPVPIPETISVKTIQTLVRTGDGEYENQKQLEFYISTPLLSEGQAVRILWELERTFKLTDTPVEPGLFPKTCYITERFDQQNISLLDANLLQTSRIDQYTLFSTPIDSKFAEGYILTVFQNAMSPEGFDHWTNVSKLVSRTGNMFESPPGYLMSNVYNVDDPEEDVVGFFYTLSQEVVRLKIDSTITGQLRKECPPPFPPTPGEGAISLCVDCLSAPRSDTIAPSFWY